MAVEYCCIPSVHELSLFRCTDVYLPCSLCTDSRFMGALYNCEPESQRKMKENLFNKEYGECAAKEKEREAEVLVVKAKNKKNGG